jgi:hypothetical protein
LKLTPGSRENELYELASPRLHLIFIPLLFAILLGPSLLAPASGAAITVTVSRDSVSVQMNFQLTENLTTSLPTLDTVVDQSSPTLASIQSGFQSMVPATRIEQLSLHARTAEVDNRTGLWVFQENYTITVSGVTNNSGSRIAADLAFLSSRNNQSIMVSGVELNNVGQSYLLQGYQRFPPDSKTRYFAQTGEYTLPLIPEQFTSSFSILDLSWTSHGVNTVGGYQPFNSSTIWNIQPRITPYNVTVGTGLTTEQTFLKKYTAYLGSSMEIIAPPNAQAAGTTILFDLPTIAETIAPIIIVVSLVTAIATFLLERRISKPIRIAKKGKR